MIKRKVEELKEKIKNKNLELNEDDKIVINMYPELTTNIFRVLSEDIKYWNERIGNEILDESTLQYIPTEVADQFWINYMINEFNNNNTYDLDDIENILNIIEVKEETREKIREIAKNHGVNENNSLNDQTLQTLLDEKRFDLIASINKSLPPRTYISPELSRRLVEEFPYDQYDSPSFFASFPELIEDKLDKISIKTLIALIYKQEYEWDDIYKINREKLQEQFVETLKRTKLESPDFLNENFNTISFFIPYNSQKEISEISFNNNILNFVTDYYDTHPESKEECYQKVLQYINKAETKEYITRLIPIIEKSELLIDALIENGFIESVINNRLLNNYPEKKSTILEHIKSNNPKYSKDQLFSFASASEEHLDIIEELINSKMILTITLYDVNKISEKMLEFVTKMIQKYPDLNITGLAHISETKGIEQLVIELIKQKKYKDVTDIISYYNNQSIFTYIYNNNKEFLLNTLKDSLFFSRKIIEIVPDKIFENKELLEFFFKEQYLAKEVINYINHHEEYEYLYNQETFDLVKESIAATIGIASERLIKFEQKFGPKVIRFIDNENVINILKMNEETFEKFLNLFPNVEYTMNDLEAAYDSLKQYEFSKKYPKVISIFPTILHAIEDKNEEIITNAINELYVCLDDTFFKEANQKYQFPEGYDQTNPKLFVTFIIEKIKNTEGEKKEKYIGILHDVTDYYISRKRGDYRNTYNMPKELDLPYTLDQKSADREYLKLLIEESYDHQVRYVRDKSGNIIEGRYRLYEYISRKLTYYGLELDLARALICYNNKSDGRTLGYSEDLLKSNYKYLIKALNEIAKDEPPHFIFQDYYKESYILRLDNEAKIKRKYTPGPPAVDINSLQTNLRVDVLQECVLNNDEVYESLKNLMTKKKIHLLPATIKNILNNDGINISDDLTNIAAFISYYGQIYAKEKSNLASNNRPTDNININLTNVLINAEVYAGVSSVYSQILGDEDSKLIKANPGPNSATSKLANNGRLNEAIELTEKLFRRQTVTIPTFNECIKLSEDKSLRVVAGNFTHPSNLTHGERTGACMRIGGVGETLFQFAINNPNGFHIRFEDPETGKYISRVTGFRNGNTVFLNELRNSCDPDKYTDEHVIEACKKAAEMLIELSKNSSCPIENVVVHRAYATTHMPERNVSLNVKNIKEGLPGFYTDVDSHPIVLATTATDKPFTMVDLDNSKVPVYQPAREIPITYTNGAKASGKIIRIDSIKRMLEGENYEHIAPLEFENGLTYAIVSDDWYIYVDAKGNVHKDCIDIDPRAKEELAEYLIKLETEMTIEPTQKEDSYGF